MYDCPDREACDASRPVRDLHLGRQETHHDLAHAGQRREGKHDNAVARAHYQDWAAGISNARLVEFPDSAHLVNIDQVDEFNQTVLEFLDNL